MSTGPTGRRTYGYVIHGEYLQIADFFGPTSDCNHSETLRPNHLKFAVPVVPTMGPCGLKLQVIRTKGSRVIAVGSLS